MILFLLILIALAVVFGRGAAQGALIVLGCLILALYLIGTIITAFGG